MCNGTVVSKILYDRIRDMYSFAAARVLQDFLHSAKDSLT